LRFFLGIVIGGDKMRKEKTPRFRHTEDIVYARILKGGSGGNF